jgi:hypothetical protein
MQSGAQTISPVFDRQSDLAEKSKISGFLRRKTRTPVCRPLVPIRLRTNPPPPTKLAAPLFSASQRGLKRHISGHSLPGNTPIRAQNHLPRKKETWFFAITAEKIPRISQSEAKIGCDGIISKRRDPYDGEISSMAWLWILLSLNPMNRVNGSVDLLRKRSFEK